MKYLCLVVLLFLTLCLKAQVEEKSKSSEELAKELASPNATIGTMAFPFGTNVIKVTKFGKLPDKFSLQYWFNIAKPDPFASQQQIRFQIAPVLALSWY